MKRTFFYCFETKKLKVLFCLVAASTMVLHKWRNNFTLTVTAGAWMLAAAMIKKEVVQRNWQFFPDPMKKVVIKRREWGTNADPRYM